MTAYNFQQLIDFTRTTSATFVGSNGLIQNTPASVNLLTWTQEFDNAAWTKSAATVTANSTTAPDGTMTADTITATASNGHILQQVVLGAGIDAIPSIWIRRRTGTGTINMWNATGTTVNVTSQVTTEWSRVFVPPVTCSSGPFLFLQIVTSGDAVDVWGAQFETGSTATTYTRNVGGRFPARFDYDPVTLAPRGILIEEQRTNLLLRSEEFANGAWGKGNATVTANATLSPDGNTNADKLIPIATATDGRVAETFTGTIGATYTLTLFAKQAEFTNCRLYSDDSGSNIASVSYNLATGAVSTAATVVGTWTGVSTTVADVGNGWLRLTLTWTATGAAPTRISYWCRDTGNGTSGIFVWGAQLETGAFATSYIPTVASQVTRTADQASIVAPMFAPWYNQTEGTFVAEWAPYATGNFNAFSATDGTTLNRIQMTGSNSFQFLVGTSGVVQALIDAGTVNVGAVNKVAGAYRANDFAASLNNSAAITDTAGTVPTVTRFDIGNLAISFEYLNGHIRRITYYPVRLLDTQLQALTA